MTGSDTYRQMALIAKEVSGMAMVAAALKMALTLAR